MQKLIKQFECRDMFIRNQIGKKLGTNQERKCSKWCSEWCERGSHVANYKNVRIVSYSLSEKYKDIELNELGFME